MNNMEKYHLSQSEQGIVGGLGISIVKSMSKYAEYVYSNNKNILIIIF